MQSAQRFTARDQAPYNSGFRTRRDEQAVWNYGFDPAKYGFDRYSVHADMDPHPALPTNLKPGDLVIKVDARKPIDPELTNQPNFLRVRQVGEVTYYMFSPLDEGDSVEFVAMPTMLRIKVGRPVNIEIRQQGGSLVIVAVNPESGDEVERYVM